MITLKTFDDLVCSPETPIREVMARGQVHYGPAPLEAQSLAFRRSVYAVADIPAGTTLTRDNVRSIRPGFGLAVKALPQILGRKARVDITRGTPISWDVIS
ncbi:MAG: hypothetical protein IH999_08490 [Proteobacteria bacterium]|nr:hypothetical protein [Pseudomonadota bacterium]